MAKAQPLRLMDARYCFQTNLDTHGEYQQFFVRASKRNGQLAITFDLYGAEGGGIEGLDASLLDAIKAAIEMVKGRVKADELSEQE